MGLGTSGPTVPHVGYCKCSARRHAVAGCGYLPTDTAQVSLPASLPLSSAVHSLAVGVVERLERCKWGSEHGGYCVGCCWFLMGLLFFGGVMNLYWIMGLAVFVLLEKVLPMGHWLGTLVGIALIVSGDCRAGWGTAASVLWDWLRLSYQ